MTHDRPNSETANTTHANARVVAMCVAVLAAMGGLTAASVPLYRLFCQVTGYDGTTQRADSAPVKVIDRLVTVRFDANVAPGLNWQFRPMQRDVTLKLGEVTTIRYFAKNLSKRTITGNATFNVTPESTGVYFNKIECFCFTETKLAPGESLEMPVVFFVDPQMADSEETSSVRTITLSYTFYAADDEEPVAAAPAKRASGG
jgi:cytochrome c oxidase assembly protein subunit 11